MRSRLLACAMCAVGLSLAVPAPAQAAEQPVTMTTKVKSTGYPLSIGVGESKKVVVNFRKTFSSVQQVCLTATFSPRDPLGPGPTGDSIHIDYPRGVRVFMAFTGSPPGGEPVYQLTRCATRDGSGYYPLGASGEAKWRDGREPLNLVSVVGDDFHSHVIITSLTAEITGVPAG